MLRGIAGVIVGYIVMFVFIASLFTGMWFVLKKEGTFEAGTYDPTMAWSVGMLVLGLVAALIGGMVCRKIGGSPKANVALAVLVIILGGLSIVVPSVMAADNVDTIEEAKEVLEDLASGDVVDDAVNKARFAAGEMGAFEEMNHAMMNAKEPLWVSLGNIFVGVVGVILGGKLVGGCKTSD